MPCVCLKTVEAQAVTVSTQKQQRHYETDTVSRGLNTNREKTADKRGTNEPGRQAKTGQILSVSCINLISPVQLNYNFFLEKCIYYKLGQSDKK